MYFIGIDIAKTNHVAAIINLDGDIIVRNIKFTNSQEGFTKLLETIELAIGNFDNLCFGMEATGHYWLALFSALVEKDFNVSVFNPYQIKSYRGAYNNRKQKNDIIDSIIIADYLRVFGTSQTSLPEEEILGLKELTRYRSNVVDYIASLKTKVIGILDKIFPEYNSIFSDTFGVTSKQLLLNCPTPEDILTICTPKLTEILSKHSRGRFKEADALSIKDLAYNSFGIKITRDVCAFEIKQIINQIIFLEEQVREIDMKIKSIYDELDSHLLTVPGVGATLAPIILAEIGDINNFEKPSKLIAYAGIDPSENQSGNKFSNNETMSKRGSPHLRRAIYTASLVAIKNVPTLRTYYDKKRNEGKHHFVALNNISRKILTIIFYILKEKRDYIEY